MVKKYLITVGKIVSFSFMVVFVILIFHFLYNEGDKPLAIGCLSVAIASLSIFLGICSEKRMWTLTESHYNAQYSDLNTRRLELREKLLAYQAKLRDGSTRAQLRNDEIGYGIFHSFSIWKCLRNLKSIIGLKEYLDSGQQGEVIHEIDCLFQDLGDGKDQFGINLDDNYKGQVQSIYNLVSEFSIFNNDAGRVRRMQDNLGFLRDEGPNHVTHFQRE